MRRWERRKRRGPVLFCIRRDESGVVQRGITVPRVGGGYPPIVLRADTYGDVPFLLAVVGDWAVSCAHPELRDSAEEFGGREFAGYVWNAGRREAVA